jgi:hypothetical protein
MVSEPVFVMVFEGGLEPSEFGFAQAVKKTRRRISAAKGFCVTITNYTSDGKA